MLGNTRLINPFKLSEKLDKLFKKNENMLKEFESLTADAKYSKIHGLKFNNQARLTKLKTQAIKLKHQIEKETLKIYKKNIKSFAKQVKKVAKGLPKRLYTNEIKTLLQEINNLSNLKSYNFKEIKEQLTKVMKNADNTLSKDFANNEMFSTNQEDKKIVDLYKTIYETTKGATIEISNFNEKFKDKLLWTIADSNLDNVFVKDENKQVEKQKEIIKEDRELIDVIVEDANVLPNKEIDISVSNNQKEMNPSTSKEDLSDGLQK